MTNADYAARITWHGWAGRGKARRGAARRGRARITRQGRARLGSAGQGAAGHGLRGTDILHRKGVKKLGSIKLPRWKELVDKAKNWGYGDIYTHGEIARIMQVKAKTPKYYNSVATANKHLLLAGKRLKNINGIGYQVLRPDDYINESAREVDRAKNKVRRAVAISAYAPVELMTEEGRERHTSYTDRLAAFAALAQKETTQLKILAANDKAPKIQISR